MEGRIDRDPALLTMEESATSHIEGVPVSNRHITLSLFYEYRKLGKMLPVSDLGPYGMYLKETI